MKFLHDDPDFADLLRIVAAAQPSPVGVALVEKDYWVTHTLWALQHQGFELWFKGGTSLSKGFGLLQRFSEDIDVKIEPGTVRGLAVVTNWTSESKSAVLARSKFFESLEESMRIPGCDIRRPGNSDPQVRGREIEVLYRATYASELPKILRAHVLLEVGSARTEPSIECDVDSWVHAHVRTAGRSSEFQDNRPRRLRCLHPVVTLLEKLDAIGRRFQRADVDPAAFVRHYDDASCIIRRVDALPPLSLGHKGLVEEMIRSKDVKRMLSADDAAFSPRDEEPWGSIRRAHDAIAPLYWGPRVSLDEACHSIRVWLRALGPSDG